MMALSNKHKAFIDEYFINGFVASKAYLSVYKGVTEETSITNGSRLLTNANIKLEIENRQAEIKAKYEINRDEIVEITKRIMNDNEKIAPPFALKAIEILNKMAGLNAAEKIDHTIKTEQPLFGPGEIEE
jgi:phage terminase small subunit